MKNNHEIILKQYAAYCKEQPLYLGTAGSYGMEMLTIIREGVWAEYDILAAFHPPVGAAVQVRVGANNQIDVPIEATAEKGMGEIVFAGYKEGVRQIAVDVLYKVAPSSGANGTEPAEPTPDVVQQLMSAANAAKKLAQSVRDDADAGKFNGAKGDKGDIGPTGPQGEQGPKGERGEKGDPGKDAVIDTTLTHAGEAADAAEVGKLKEDTTALQKRQNVLVGSENGNPVSCNDAYSAPLCGLTVYGKSTQDGTPTPDAPVPIVSAGDGGSISAKVTGKNLLNPSLFQNNKYQSFNAESGYYEIDSVNNYWITGIQPCLPSTTYHFNVYTEGGCFYDEKKNVIGIIGFEFTVKTPSKCAYYCINFSTVRLPYGSPVIATVSESATYSPYREQSLTLQTPNGLPGVPVTSGGNYTDPQGQQWVCDEVDFGKSVKVQRIDKGAFDSTKTLAEQNVILATPVETPLTPAEIAAYKALTAYAPDTVVQASDGAGIKLDYQRDVNLVVKNLEDAIASMTTT